MNKIEANNILINYELEGNGKTIVFIHGLSDSLNYWSPLQSNLKEDYQTLSFDLRAHGNSGDDGSKITIDLYSEDLYHLLKKLNISDAVFIGLSLGGNVALNFAIKHPEMVNGLIIMSSFCEFNKGLQDIFDNFYLGIQEGFGEFFDIILPYTLPEEMLEKNREVLEFVREEGIKTANIEGIKAGIKAGYSFSITDKLNTINAPAIVISGKDDELTDLNMQKKIHENLKNSEMIILEDTKHNILIGSNIVKIINIIKDFMQKIS